MSQRPIKFRAWKGTRMTYLDDEYVSEALYYTKNGKAEVMQYTGLKDKNGAEIYEGDIVKMANHWASGWDKPMEVSYDAGAFFPFGTGDWEPDIEYNRLEVIGNIHENPELIK